MPESKISRLNLIGGGRVGCSLARWLQARSGVVIGDVMTTGLSTSQAAVDQLQAGHAIARLEALQPAELLLIAIPDSRLPALVQELAGSDLDLQQTVVCHTSGMFDHGVFDPINNRVSGAAAIHPLKAFSSVDMSITALDGMLCIASGDDVALQVLRPLFHAARWREADLADRQLYHAGAVLLSNLVRGLAVAGETVLTGAGLDKPLTREIRDALMSDAFEDFQGQSALTGLTGPLQRGDLDTVKAQLQALSGFPHAKAVYKSISEFLSQQLAEQQPFLDSGHEGDGNRGSDPK